MTLVIALAVLSVVCASLLCGHVGSHTSGTLTRRRRPITGHLRPARACLTGAGLALTASLCAALTVHPWLVMADLYPAALLTLCARGFYADHRRAIAEADWERRLVLGEHPEPLRPCCALADRSGGTAHGGLCTDLSRHNLSAPTWKDGS